MTGDVRAALAPFPGWELHAQWETPEAYKVQVVNWNGYPAAINSKVLVLPRVEVLKSTSLLTLIRNKLEDVLGPKKIPCTYDANGGEPC